MHGERRNMSMFSKKKEKSLYSSAESKKREFGVKSKASMHRSSQKNLNSAGVDTLRGDQKPQTGFYCQRSALKRGSNWIRSRPRFVRDSTNPQRYRLQIFVRKILPRLRTCFSILAQIPVCRHQVIHPQELRNVPQKCLEEAQYFDLSRKLTDDSMPRPTKIVH